MISGGPFSTHVSVLDDGSKRRYGRKTRPSADTGCSAGRKLMKCDIAAKQSEVHHVTLTDFIPKSVPYSKF
jgi:hypothetical protein